MADKPLSILESKKKDLELDLSDADLRHLYTTMVRVRRMDEKLILLQRQGRIGFYLSCLGQEACHIGAAFALNEDDWLYPHYRNPGTPLLRGVSMQRMVHQCYGNAEDEIKGRQMPVHYSFKDINFFSISSPLGTQIVQAAGTAYAMKLKGTKQVAMTSFGDGSSSEIDFHSGLNFAAVTKSPCIFMLENNQWAISVPTSKQSASESYAIKAAAYGMPGIQVDGNDVLAVYKVTKEAVDRARRGEGPTLIELVTFRMGAHSTSDDPSRYCPPEQLKEWALKDPLKRFEAFLLKNKVFSQADMDKLAKDAVAEVEEAIKNAEKAAPMPEVGTMFDDVYENVPEQLLSQRDDMLRDHKEHGVPGSH
ncbi:MAG TPA: thiamine pyrophosphate-dependent dehydrogenase E1 component subunit alpha [Candidatus Thermoplasmatota archaeon]|nr:thiamine pyrophosphate-dependent dehydrogenase E1 component subunit alpha [Candidatus Thermoplasmatota archaeon]